MAVQPVPGERVESLLGALPRGLAPRFTIPMGALGVFIKLSADVLMASIASVAGMVWAQRSGLPIPPVWMMSCYAPLLIALFAARSAYRRKLHNTLLEEFMSVQTTAALAAMMLLAGMVVTDVRGDLGDTVAKVWLATAALLPIGRLSAVTAKRDLRRRHRLQSRTLIVGNGVVATHLAQRFTDNPQYGILPVGLIDADPESAGVPRSVCTLPPAGTPATMAAAIRDTGAEAVVVAFSQTRDEDLVPAIRAARLAGLTVWVVPRMFDAVNKRSRVDYVGGMPVLDLSSTNPRSWQFTAKHVADRMLAALILLVIAPLLAALAVAVRVSSPGPVFYRQPRIGRDGIVFDCLKFRSMRSPVADQNFVPRRGAAPGGVEGADRRTAVGRFLRSSSLDELPQLINVIRGDMSLVGPRPERPEYVELFNNQIRRYGERHRVKAGMTGWAQVHGLRGQTSIDDRAEWDNYYIENWSLALDLQILLMTVPAVLRSREQVSPPA